MTNIHIYLNMYVESVRGGVLKDYSINVCKLEKLNIKIHIIILRNVNT